MDCYYYVPLLAPPGTVAFGEFQTANNKDALFMSNPIPQLRTVNPASSKHHHPSNLHSAMREASNNINITWQCISLSASSTMRRRRYGALPLLHNHCQLWRAIGLAARHQSPDCGVCKSPEGGGRFARGNPGPIVGTSRRLVAKEEWKI